MTDGAFAQELARAGVPVDYEIVAEATHGFLNRPGTAHLNTGIGAIVRWLGSQPKKRAAKQFIARSALSID
ncbi:acetyl esterase/lipase [Paenarthrobacter nicotinovorans]|uniref:Acetyl esterase/lipase n=1 Tax=Paenarthrobacter nicotinovorans TaxID=29320 RepID=A0ABT9TN20_PAENI|nr:hypothetical protein [Paenarthrobacter nicotinovorans]MDQ0103070.1 acetyl esterase/lipase [Paenarthrobacter nicotinovorans]